MQHSMNIFHIVQITIGAALGALLRYAMILYIPLPVFWANMSGSFLIGLLYPVLSTKFPQYIPFINIGFLGAFTTFSSFSFRIFEGLKSGFVWKSLSYGLVSLVLGVFLCFLGYWLGEKLRFG
jgi:fluoride exporter